MNKLQDRKLYTVGYSYDGIGYHYIRVGAYDLLEARIVGARAFRKLYDKDSISFHQITVG